MDGLGLSGGILVLAVQILGLIGSHGILPVSDFLNFIGPNRRGLNVFGQPQTFAGLMTVMDFYCFYAGAGWRFQFCFCSGYHAGFERFFALAFLFVADRCGSGFFRFSVG
jgi:hypothetical protein